MADGKMMATICHNSSHTGLQLASTRMIESINSMAEPSCKSVSDMVAVTGSTWHDKKAARGLVTYYGEERQEHQHSVTIFRDSLAENPVARAGAIWSLADWAGDGKKVARKKFWDGRWRNSNFRHFVAGGL
ncbi:hypothetical protein DFH07DRAFT_764406 [Mycena maculata]|uniref:Uncharacterized protein n=1 Tax=Mycena maculata TaxID=230809 RepID=A0AAD7KCZ8_9AGAR|nr:hypothetical protein DFH07DRAFT_764406 [Mycena maculata]